MLARYKAKIAELIPAEVTAEDIVIPPDTTLGDLAFPCFALAKAEGKNPADIAEGLANEIKKPDWLEKN